MLIAIYSSVKPKPSWGFTCRLTTSVLLWP